MHFLGKMKFQNYQALSTPFVGFFTLPSKTTWAVALLWAPPWGQDSHLADKHSTGSTFCLWTSLCWIKGYLRGWLLGVVGVGHKNNGWDPARSISQDACVDHWFCQSVIGVEEWWFFSPSFKCKFFKMNTECINENTGKGIFIAGHCFFLMEVSL